MNTGVLEVAERYDYAADVTKNAQMDGRYQCQRVETVPR